MKYQKNTKSREKLIKAVQLRADETLRSCAMLKEDAKIRVLTSRDIVAAEAHYHASCYKIYTILGNPGVYSVARYSLPEKYPWERSLLELVPEVKIQNGGKSYSNQNILDPDWSTFLGRPIRNESNFDFRNKFRQISFPGVFLWERITKDNIYPWVPKDGALVLKPKHKNKLKQTLSVCASWRSLNIFGMIPCTRKLILKPALVQRDAISRALRHLVSDLEDWIPSNRYSISSKNWKNNEMNHN